MTFMTSPSPSLTIQSIDHIEFATSDFEGSLEKHLRFGFELVGEKTFFRSKLSAGTKKHEIKKKSRRSALLSLHGAIIILTESLVPDDHAYDFVKAHGSGIASIAFLVSDAISQLEDSLYRGATLSSHPLTTSNEFGQVTHCSIEGFSHIEFVFISRVGTYFLEGFDFAVATKKNSPLSSIYRLQHIAAQDELDTIAHFYTSVLGLHSASLPPLKTLSNDRDEVKEDPKAASYIFHSRNSPLSSSFQITLHPPQGDFEKFFDIHHGGGFRKIHFKTTPPNQELTQKNSDPPSLHNNIHEYLHHLFETKVIDMDRELFYEYLF